MIIVTGAGGFIGAHLAARLNGLGYRDLVLVDDWNDPTKAQRLESGLLGQTVHRDAFPDWLHHNQAYVQQVFHLGARTDTMLGDEEVFDRLNLIMDNRTSKRSLFTGHCRGRRGLGIQCPVVSDPHQQNFIIT